MPLTYNMKKDNYTLIMEEQIISTNAQVETDIQNNVDNNNIRNNEEDFVVCTYQF